MYSEKILHKDSLHASKCFVTSQISENLLLVRMQVITSGQTGLLAEGIIIWHNMRISIRASHMYVCMYYAFHHSFISTYMRHTTVSAHDN